MVKIRENSQKLSLAKNTIRDVEEFYANGFIENLEEKINQSKDIIVNEMVEYAKKNKKEIFDKNGNIVGEEVKFNPLVINNMFFKPITKSSCFVPKYNAEKLAVLFDYYNYLIENINENIGTFPSSIASFCKLAGISSATLKNYKNSDDPKMREVVQIIYDQIGDENITLGQLGKVRSPMTIFKMKSQNDIVEKQTPNVNINLTEELDMNKIKSRLDRYKNLIDVKDVKEVYNEQ